MGNKLLSSIKSDLPASIVVFFVAIPLCLGIALASGAPLFAGLISGVIGGVVVGMLSGSKVGVSGPAAGLAAIVLSAISSLGSFESFLVAVVLAGVLQIIFGLLKAGLIAYYFPSSVIKGMLTGIGIIIILKQIPHFFGYDSDPAGDFSFLQSNGENTFTAIVSSFAQMSFGSTLIGFIALGILYLWGEILERKSKIYKLIQGPIVAVAVGILYFTITKNNSWFAIEPAHMVALPISEDMSSFLSQFNFPNFEVIINPEVWLVAFSLALVASLETLLCVEATDKLDPHKNVTPTNRELFAQGTGNIISGLIGGLPITQVIVRSSANIQSGGSSKLSAILHGVMLLISVLLIPTLLNRIPLSVLAAILLVVGYKLAKPVLFQDIYRLGWNQFLPFILTVLGIVFIDMLVGMAMGLFVGGIIVLIQSYQNSHFLHKEVQDDGIQKMKMALAEEVTFINKGAILHELDDLPHNSFLEIDVSNTRYLDYDIIEILEDFALKAKERSIDITLVSARGEVKNPESYIDFLKLSPMSEANEIVSPTPKEISEASKKPAKMLT